LSKVLVITAGEPRHTYFANCVSRIFNNDPDVLIVEKSSKHISKTTDPTLKAHSERLAQHELNYFESALESNNMIKVDRTQLNTAEFVENLNLNDYSVCFVFGSPILNSVWFRNSLLKINLHLGLSPYYIGSGTLFWPFNNDDVKHAGITWHELTKELDMGRPIIRYKFDSAQGNYYDLINVILKFSMIEGLKFIKEKICTSQSLFTHEYEQNAVTRKYVRSDITAAEIRNVNNQYSNAQDLQCDITSC
tara:strand:- start:447 stop:1193 length:747 start_codon:yes stop_codon:yes gene_type:complete